MNITERQEKILNYLVEKYIRTAVPVSSDLLEKSCRFDVSAPTIRNDLQELAKKRYIIQLHTSGGRVPTDKAYRYFVNELIDDDDFEPAAEEKRKIRTTINSTEDPRRLNKSIAQVLSDLSDSIVITNILDDYVDPAKAGSLSATDFYKIGLASLVEFPEFRDMERILEMTNLFDRFESMFGRIENIVKNRAFDDSRTEDEFNVLIGEENLLDHIKNETMILVKYSLPDGLRGSLTMIGPTRMDYERNIGLVRYTAEMLNKTARNV
jgi:heat-inducible transcriptional repressor